MLEHNPQDEDTQWAVLAKSQPRLATHAKLHTQAHQRTESYWLSNEVTGQHAKFNATAFAILSRLDGERTLQQILDEVNQLKFAQCGSIGLLQLIAKLQRLGVVVGADLLPAETLRDDHANGQKNVQLKRWFNPLALRFKCFDPDRLLSAITPYFSSLFTRLGVKIWLAVLLMGVATLCLSWHSVQDEFLTRTLRPQSLWWFAVLFPMMKVLHEMAHAVCIKHWGGQVREAGISLLLLIPVPYIDASDVHGGFTRRQRLCVTAAGMGVELFVAATALIGWWWIDPGYLRDALFTVFIIGGLTTLLFNANPLLKFDGYYLLQDALNTHNLASRSSVWLQYQFKRFVLGMEQLAVPVVQPHERRWLTGYAIAVALYKPILTITIIVFLWRSYPMLGMLLALFALVNQWLLPTFKGVRWMLRSDELGNQRYRALGLVFCLTCALSTLLLIPMPSSTRVQGVVAAAAQGEVFTELAGVATRIHVEAGSRVQAGDVLVTLSNPVLARDLAQVEAELAATKGHRMLSIQKLDGDSGRNHATVQAETDRLERRRDELLSQTASLSIIAEQAGIFAPVENTLLPGRYIQQGVRIGYVVNGVDWTVRTVIPENRAPQLRAGVNRASVRLAQAGHVEIEAAMLRETPALTRQLPNSVLSQHAGGFIVTDPYDTTHTQSLENLFEVELVLPAETPVFGLGQRAWVQLEHPAEAFITRLWRLGRSVWLTRDNLAA